MSSPIEDALKSAKDTREVVIAAGALEEVPRVLDRLWGPGMAQIVSDQNTFHAGGRELAELLRSSGRATVEPIIFEGSPPLHADFGHVLTLEEAFHVSNAIPIAVGSGTLNDLTKLAAHRCQRAYLSVATAASMDGYTAFAAAISHDGIKQVDPCPAPRALVADLDVLRQAPRPMSASGYGDLLGKVIAGADWILADELGIESIHPEGWNLVMPHLARWTDRPSRLPLGEPEAIENLVEGLVMAGLAMQAASSTRPASGSEHLFSHLWEMDGIDASHGFKVGLGTLAAAALYEMILEANPSAIEPEAILASWPSRSEAASAVRGAHPDPVLAGSAVEETLAKYPDPPVLLDRLHRIRAQWPRIAIRLRAQLVSAARLRQMLAEAGCPVTPEAIGLTRDQFKASYTRARTIRRRYTILDFAVETGLLHAAVESLFAPGGFWQAR